MKAYRMIDTFFAPGQQPKGAEKVEVPTDTAGLVGFLNDLVQDIAATASVGDRMATIAAKEEASEPVGTKCPNCQRMIPNRAPHCDCGVDPVRVEPSAPARFEDEDFDALPLPRQLHLAALAVENARSRLK